MTINFDNDSVYVDRTGADGKFYDTFGNYKGYCDGSGRYFDASGVYKGTRKEDGMFYDAAGVCLGYTDGKHWCFDALGIFVKSKRPGEEPAKKEPNKDYAPKEEGEKKGLSGKLKSAWDKL